jgi:hypothetical protein
MDVRPRFSLARRGVLAAGLGAMVLATVGSRDASARLILQRGMSGGGLAQLEGTEEPRLANFGLFASSLQLPEGTPLVLGALQWLEAGTDLQLQSIEITQCIPSNDRASAAEVRGRLRVNGEGDYPFVVWATDGGRPGSALDRIEIQVNTPTAREGAPGEPSDDAFLYEAAGNLVAGDFQWVIADIEI